MNTGERNGNKDEEKKSVKDFGQIFENIRQMFICSRHCVNQVTENTLLAGMATEVELLTLKIKCMLARWEDYLPLHEYDAQKWAEWTAVVDDILAAMDDYQASGIKKEYLGYQPSNEFLFDLYDAYKKEQGLYAIDAVSGKETPAANDSTQVLQSRLEDIGKLINELVTDRDPGWFAMACSSSCERLGNMMHGIPITSHFIDEDETRYTQRIKHFFDTLQSYDELFLICRMCMKNLRRTLDDVDAIFNQDISSTAFEQLSIRQKYHLCMPDLRSKQRAVKLHRQGRVLLAEGEQG